MDKRATATVLPLRVPDLDIGQYLYSLQFPTFGREPTPDVLAVSGTYVEGLLYFYRECGGKEDILKKVMRRNLPDVSDTTRKLLTQGMIPWPLYEIITEEVRRQLVTERPNDSITTPTFFSFISGVHGVINEPRLVGAAAILPLETIISEINTYNAGMNMVTTIELQKNERTSDKTISVHLKRQQKSESLDAFNALLGQYVSDPELRKAILASVCARDLATTLGAFFGVNLLAGKPTEAITLAGDPGGTTQITVSYMDYSRHWLSRAHQILTAVKLGAYRTFGYYRRDRDQFIEEKMAPARYVLQQVELQSAIEDRIQYERAAAAAHAQIALERAKREAEEARHRFQEMVAEVNTAVDFKDDHLHVVKNLGLAILASAAAYLRDKKDVRPIHKIIALAKDIETHTREGMAATLTTNEGEFFLDSILDNVLGLITPIYRNVTFERQYDTATTIRGDRKYLEAALANILENAACASATSKYPGKILIEAEVLIDVRTYTKMVIQQSGFLSAPIAERLNNGESFTTKGAHGSGRGAQSSKKIIEDMCIGTLDYIAGNDTYDGNTVQGGTIEIIV